MPNPRWKAVSACVAIAALVLSGCGSGSGGPGGANNDAKTLDFVATLPPENLNLLDRQGSNRVFTDPAGDVLLTRNPEDGSLHPELATSWEMVAPDKWQFTLRSGVKFHDDTPFDAAAAAWAIERQTAPESKGLVVRYAPNLKAEAVDATTLLITCPTTCPILDKAAQFFQFESPTWRKANPDKNWPMGLGPFYLDDWKDGEYLHYKKFAGYWGDAGYFNDVKITWRAESGVRASMVATGEADLTQDLSVQDMKSVPQTFLPPTPNYVAIQVRSRGADGQPDPIWGDVRFRQALGHAINCEEMVKTLMNGITKCNALPFHPSTVGYDENIKGYAYDPAKARELLDEVLGKGKTLDGVKLVAKTGDVPRIWGETILSYWKDIGINATFEFIDGARNIDEPGVGNMPPDAYIYPRFTNDVTDASISLRFLDGCNERRSFNVCDEDFVHKLDVASAASGDQRAQLMQQLVRDYFIGGATFISLWEGPMIFGAVENFRWSRPEVGWLRPAAMSLSD